MDNFIFIKRVQGQLQQELQQEESDDDDEAYISLNQEGKLENLCEIFFNNVSIQINSQQPLIHENLDEIYDNNKILQIVANNNNFNSDSGCVYNFKQGSLQYTNIDKKSYYDKSGLQNIKDLYSQNNKNSKLILKYASDYEILSFLIYKEQNQMNLEEIKKIVNNKIEKSEKEQLIKPLYMYMLSDINQKLQKFNEGIQNLEQIKMQYRHLNQAKIHFKIGVLKSLQGRNSNQVINHYHIAIKQDNNLFWAYYNLGNEYNKMNYYPEALKLIKFCLKINNQQNNSVLMLMSLANIYIKYNDFEKAINILNSLLIQHENIYEAYQNLGYCYIQLNQRQEALNSYKKCLELMHEESKQYQDNNKNKDSQDYQQLINIRNQILLNMASVYKKQQLKRKCFQIISQQENYIFEELVSNADKYFEKYPNLSYLKERIIAYKNIKQEKHLKEKKIQVQCHIVINNQLWKKHFRKEINKEIMEFVL